MVNYYPTADDDEAELVVPTRANLARRRTGGRIQGVRAREAR